MSRFKAATMLGLCLALIAPMALMAQTATDPAREKAIAELEQKLGFRSIDPFTGNPETAEERQARLGTTEDPGADPDPEKVFLRKGEGVTIQKFPKEKAAFDQAPGLVRPMAFINIAREIYREDDEHVWVWLFTPGAAHGQEPAPEPSDPQFRVPYPVEIEALEKIRSDFEPLAVPKADRTLRFVESSAGLPTQGSWRNALAVADMNGDGHLDLLVPPQRGADRMARIFLGDGKGGWKRWEEADFDWGLDYGTAAAGDLNGDGHMDAVFAVHLRGVRVFLHDGQGKFVSRTITGIPEYFPTRRLVLHDMNGDGKLDIVAISEGPTMGRDDMPLPPARIQIYLNDGDGTSWTPVMIGHERSEVGGDWLKVANLDGDRYPDLVTSSIYFSGPEALWMGQKNLEWTSIGRNVLPFYSYYFAVETGKFTKKKTDDAIYSFVRSWPENVDPEVVARPANMQMVGLERVSWEKGKPVRTSIARWPALRSLFSMGQGDFDNDGNLDLIYALVDPREARILLGDGRGGFREARVEGLDLPENSSYQITVADVDGDGRPDLIIMFEAQVRTDGSIKVWLNRTEK